jgi:hypothetical protein
MPPPRTAVPKAPTAPRAPTVEPEVAAEKPSAQETAPARSATRFSTRDYSFVRREIRRIAMLGIAIIVVILVLSFFFP